MTWNFQNNLNNGGTIVDDIFIKALYNRIKSGQMTAEQVPEIYREDVQAMIEVETETDVVEGTHKG